MDSKYLFAGILALFVLCITVGAVPTTGAATAVGNHNATLHATGCAGTDCWFQIGPVPGNTWAHLPNVTPSAGTISYVWSGAGIYGETTYYYRACDTTGCGVDLSFLTTEVTPIPTGNFGAYAQNMTESGFNPTNVLWNSAQAYISITGATIFYAIILMMLFVGVWISTRGTRVAMQLGMICTVFFASAAIGLQLGLPPEFVAIGQALLYVSLAGAIVSFTIR
jgi:hypothetical protein